MSQKLKRASIYGKNEVTEMFNFFQICWSFICLGEKGALAGGWRRLVGPWLFSCSKYKVFSPG